jgi:hypothetical protein
MGACRGSFVPQAGLVESCACDGSGVLSECCSSVEVAVGFGGGMHQSHPGSDLAPADAV